mgnify:CR=1 FL=1
MSNNPLIFLFRKLWQFSETNRRSVVWYIFLFVIANILWSLEPLVIGKILNIIQQSGVQREPCLGPWSPRPSAQTEIFRSRQKNHQTKFRPARARPSPGRQEKSFLNFSTNFLSHISRPIPKSLQHLIITFDFVASQASLHVICALLSI